MGFSIKTKIWNGSFFVFLFITLFSFGLVVMADESETLTAYFEDADQDGLSAEEEKAFGTDPANSDTDGDSYSDGVEIESGYDPLKPAPGDRITPEVTTESETVGPNVVNLTDIASDELVALVEEKQASQEELTPDDLNAAVAKVLENANEEVVLPEVGVDKIKIKELSDKLEETEKKLKQKEDTLEYLTTMSYILMSNSPVTIRSEEDVPGLLTKGAQDLVVALTTGNFAMFEDIKAKSDKVLEEIQAVEVPENMIGTHVKAIQIVTLVLTLGEKMKAVDPTNDPIGQMLELSKLQGALFTMQNFLDESTEKMTEIGITNIPLDF